MRRQAEREARLKREKAMQEETRRLERAAEAERKRKKRAKEHMREVQTRELYETRWKELLAPSSAALLQDDLRFEDVPWPVLVLSAHDNPATRTTALVTDFSTDAISAFLLPPSEGVDADGADAAKRRKDKLRETMLRYHPDKFEGRVMQRVQEADRGIVKEAVGIVARTVNAMMAQGK